MILPVQLRPGIGGIAGRVVHADQDHPVHAAGKRAAALGNAGGNQDADILSDAIGRVAGIARTAGPGFLAVINARGIAFEAVTAGVFAVLDLFFPLGAPEIAAIIELNTAAVAAPDDEMTGLVENEAGRDGALAAVDSLLPL